MNVTTDSPRIDVSALSWCLAEIQTALEQSEAALSKALVEGSDNVQLRAAQNYLHQAHGALAVVNITGLSRITEEVERLLDLVAQGRVELSSALVQAVSDGYYALIEYSENLVDGSLHQPVRLFAYLRDIQQLRGVDRIHPADLFFPSLSVRPPRMPDEGTAWQDGETKLVRGQFEQGLLKYLRDSNDVDGRKDMLAAVARIENAERKSAGHTFWWVTLAFFDAMQDSAIANDVYSKRLVAKLNLQVRKSLEQSGQVPEQLLVDTLFQIARVKEPSPFVAQVQQMYRMQNAVPRDYESAQYRRQDSGSLAKFKQALAECKLVWDRVSRGQTEAFSEFEVHTRAMQAQASALGANGMAKLCDAMVRVVSFAKGGTSNEAVSLEVATALLFVEEALAKRARIDAEYEVRALDMAARLAKVAAGTAPTDMPQWLADLSREAQERLTSVVFVGEMLKNLRAAEKTLDAYFRDPADAAELTSVGPNLRQTAGALSLLGHNDAALGTNAVADAANTFVAGQAVDEQLASRLAESVSALGFFVESLAKPDTLSVAYEFDQSAGVFRAKQKTSSPVTDSVAEVVDVAALPVLVQARRVDVEAATVEPIAEKLTVQASEQAPIAAIPFDFALPSLESEPAAFADTIPSVLPEVELAFDESPQLKPRTDTEEVNLFADDEDNLFADFDIEPVLAAPTLLAASAAIVPVQLTDVEIDAELMEIFLGEAEEVLGTVAQTHGELAAAPSNITHLTTIRRAFHTLKGSGRMVGLMQFGEAAWGMEQTMNLWLSEQRSANDTLLKAITACCEQFSVWVEMLRAEPRTWLDVEPMIENARRLREGEPLLEFAVSSPAQTLTEEVAVESQDVVAEEVFALEETIEESVVSGSEIREVVEVEAIDLDIVAEESTEISSPVVEISDFVSVNEELAPVDGFKETQAKLVAEPFDLKLAQPEPAHPEHDRVETKLDGLKIGALVASAGLGAGMVATSLAPESIIVQQAKPEPVFNPLHQIFIAESEGLAKVLRDEVDTLVSRADHISTEKAVRAAHSLGGSSLVVGLSQASAVAYSLEKWMVAQQKRRFAPSHGDKKAIELLVVRLSAMLQTFAQGKDQGDESIALQAALEIAAQHEVDHPGQDTLPGGEIAQTVTPSVESVVSDPVARGSELVSHAFNDELDPELLEIFLLEAEEYFPAIGSDLRKWEQTPSDASIAQSLMRAFHTVKGSARMAGAMTLGQLVHEMETKVESVAHLPRVGPEMVSGLIADYDQAVALFELLKDPSNPAAITAPVRAVEQASNLGAAVAATIAVAAPIVVASAKAQLQGSTTPMTQIRPRANLENMQASSAAASQQMVRVRSDLLERMVNEAGEVSIARSRMENEIGAIKTSINDLTENVHRLRAQLREIEIQAETQIQARHQTQTQSANFDPLEFDRFTRFQELTRMMAESVNDVATVQSTLMKSLNEASVDLTRQAQVTRDLQQNLMRVRMVQFGTISDRLYRVIRQAAKDTGKRVNLDIRGTAAEIDRSVLERMAGPLEHLLRNSVAHGIENPDARVIAGKNETGEISVEVRQEGNEVVLSLLDDGAGLNFPKIRERAVANGLLAADAVASDQKLAELIFMPGFTTATEVTTLAGRGVGMDVVRSEVAALGGRIETWSEVGKGTRFVVHLPLTLAVTQVVLVSIGETKYALPSVLVERVFQLKPQEHARVYESKEYEWQNQRIPSEYLGHLLQISGSTPVAQRYTPLIVLRSGSQHAAIHVDSIIGNQEVVVKNVGPQLSSVQGVAGATVLGNGDIVLILNPVQIFSGANYQSLRSQTNPRQEKPAENGVVDLVDLESDVPGSNAPSSYVLQVPPTVMVVDDSLTVRKVTQRMLGRERYQVVLAKDGVDALRQLQDVVPDVMLVDIEMPRMDGFDLTRNVRNDPRYKHVPIIMITSRTADKHRNHALSLGVNVYLGKPFGEEELLGHIKALTAKAVAA